MTFNYYVQALSELALAKVALDQAAVSATMDPRAAHLTDKIAEAYLVVTRVNRKAQMDFHQLMIEQLNQ